MPPKFTSFEDDEYSEERRLLDEKIRFTAFGFLFVVAGK